MWRLRNRAGDVDATPVMPSVRASVAGLPNEVFSTPVCGRMLELRLVRIGFDVSIRAAHLSRRCARRLRHGCLVGPLKAIRRAGSIGMATRDVQVQLA